MSSLADLFLVTDKRQSAIILPEGHTEIAYGSLSDQVERLAGCLRQSGLRPGQTVAIALPNGIEYLVSFLAVTRARLIVAPMNPVYKAEEFRFLLEDSEARVVITTSGADPDPIREAARALRKISPTEIDAVLLGAPAVAEAATFAVPDPIYGEEVEAAVVPRGDVTAAELQAYCRTRLSEFEIPKVIHFVKELPKEATGKVARLRLAELFSH